MNIVEVDLNIVAKVKARVDVDRFLSTQSVKKYIIEEFLKLQDILIEDILLENYKTVGEFLDVSFATTNKIYIEMTKNAEDELNKVFCS
jgi:hypothetical protein